MHDALVENLQSVWWIVLAAALAPLFALITRRYVPDVVWLLVFGTVIGPHALDIAHQTESVEFLRELGMGFLFLLAGFEVNTADMRARRGKHAAFTWLICVVLAVVAGLFVIEGDWQQSVAFGIAATSTALGTLLPVLKDSGVIDTPLGKAVMVHGAYGELLPIIAMSLLLSTRGTGISAGLLIAFAVIAVVSIALPGRFFQRATWLARMVSRASDSTMQPIMRMVVLLLVTLMLVTAVFDLDVALGAFAAGILANTVLKSLDIDHSGEIMHKVEVVGFSFLIPVFFVTSGMNIDLASVLSQWRTVLYFVGMITLLRGLPIILRELLTPTDSGLTSWRDKVALGFYSAVGLPIIVAVTQIAVSSGIIEPTTASVMVTGGALTVLIFPVIGRIVAAPAPKPQEEDVAVE